MATSVLQIIIKTLKQGTGDKDAANALGKLQTSVKNLEGAYAAFAPAAAAAGAVLAYSVNAAAEAERSQVRLGAVVRATGGAAGLTVQELNGMAREMHALTGIDDELINDAQSILLTFRSIGQEVFPDTIKAAADLTAVFGGNLNDNTKQLGKALEDPVRGLTALRKQGVSFTAEQQQMIKALVESGDKLTAQKLILAEVEKQVGGTAEALGNTFFGSLEKAKTGVGALAEEIGDDFLPAATDFNLWIADVTNNMAAANDGMDRMRQAAEMLGLEHLPPQVMAANEAIASLAVQMQGGNLATSDLQYQIQALGSTAEDTAGSLDGYVGSIMSISGAIEGGAESIQEYINKTAFTEALRKLFEDGSPTPEQLARVEEWGVGLGVIEPGTMDVYAAQEQLTEEMLEYSWNTKLANDALVSATKNGKLMAEAADLAMADRSADWHVSVTTSGPFGLVMGGMDDAEKKIRVQGSGGSTVMGMRAAGGPITDPITLVGEQGPELVVNGVVIPADMTRELMQLGLRPGQQLASGGQLAAMADNVAYGPPSRTSTRGQMSNTGQMSTPSYRAMQQARAERDSASAPAAMAAESAAAVMEAVPVVTAAAVSAGQSAQITAQALAQQTAIMTQSNNDLIDEMRRTREAVERLAPEIGLSFQKAVR